MNKRVIYGALTISAMAVIILDTKTVICGAQEGIQLCIETIIPALFPFIILSGIISSSLLGQSINLIRPIGRICKIPKGAESILLLGFLGGYPVGAQIITQAYLSGSISKITAKRMLGFCNNAGPAFLFGMFSVVFSRPIISWVLWGIHILSALTVGFLLPGEAESICNIEQTEPISPQTALKNAIKTISLICGWVIVFRIIICFCDKWFLWRFPKNFQVIISGILELSNGCIFLDEIPSEALRFIYASGIIAFGGLCVGMQTKSVTQDLSNGFYFLGKFLQTLFSVLFSTLAAPALFDEKSTTLYWSICLGVLLDIGIAIYFIFRKKLWHLQKQCSIIPLKIGRKEQFYAVSKENTPIL